MRAVLIVVTAAWSSLFAALGLAESQPGPTATPAAGLALPGVQATATRRFSTSDETFVLPAGFLGFVVTEFDEEEQAALALPLLGEDLAGWADAAEADGDVQADLRPVSAPTYRDGTLAYVGEVRTESDGFGGRMRLAMLLVRDGRFLYAMVGFRFAIIGTNPVTNPLENPLDDLLTVADRLLGPDPIEPADPPPGAEYMMGGLWDRLPRLEHLPPGFVHVADSNEATLDVPGVPASSPSTAAAAPPVQPAGSNELIDVVEALEAAHLSVDILATGLRSPVLSVPGQALDLGDARLYVFIYPDVSSRERETNAGRDGAVLPAGDLLPSEDTSGTPIPAARLLVAVGSNVAVILVGGSDDTRESVRRAIARLR